MSSDQQQSCLQSALSYASRGWRVLPLHGIVDGHCTCGRECGRAGKHPRLKAWEQRASSLEKEVRDWWLCWPISNVGIALGADTGLIVLDVDQQTGGYESLAALRDKHGPIPRTLTAKTGGGGLHYYFEAPDWTVANSVGKLGPGLDVRAERGQVVAPPSLHASGASYTWHDESPPAPLPGWLASLLGRPEKTVPRRSWAAAYDAAQDAPGRGSDYGSSALRRECAEVASAVEGSRNDTLNRAAFRMGQLVAGGELDHDAARDSLLAAAQSCGLPAHESLQTIESGMKAGSGSPRRREDNGNASAGHSDTGDESGEQASGRKKTPSWLRGCPTQDPIIPPGWTITDNGVWLNHDETPKMACPTPLLVIGRLIDVNLSEESVEVAWLDGGYGWKTLIAQRDMLVSGRSITALARSGLPVSSAHAPLLVRFIAESLVDREMPQDRVTHRMGWHADAFVLGERNMGDAPRYVTPAGAAQTVRGFKEAGTFGEWRGCIDSVEDKPMLLAAVWASLAAPLLRWLPDAQNVIVDYSGRTSTGKTTALRLAASVWGCPDERSDGVIYSWNTTRIGMERLAEVHQHVPLCMDDHTRVARGKEMPAFLYDYATGQGRVRGAADGGMQHHARYRGILLSTGETPITSYSNDAGTRARVLTLWGSPTAGMTGDAVDALTSAILRNHGHPGRILVSNLSQDVALRESLPSMYEQLRSTYSGMAKSHVGHRLAASWALVAMGGQVGSRLGLCPYRDSIARRMWDEPHAEGEEGSNTGLRAMGYVYDWCCSNSGRFFGVHQGRTEPHGGWAGAWKPGKYIALLPHVLRDVLDAQGFDYQSITRQWRDQDWLITTGDSPGRSSYLVKCMGAVWRTIAISDKTLRDTGVGTTQAPKSTEQPEDVQQASQW